jgi:hypothetical protein
MLVEEAAKRLRAERREQARPAASVTHLGGPSVGGA